MAAQPCLLADPAPRRATDLAVLRDELLLQWAATPPELPDFGPRIGFFRRLSNARAAKRFVDEIAREVARLPADEAKREAWREGLRERLHQFGQECLGWPDGYRRLLFGDAFYESTLAFARQARAFDPTLSLEDMGQALRNVWIGNCLQMLLDRRVELRPGLFAYSMLYPVTDNWLDDPAVSATRKRAFGQRFGWRLAGWPLRPLDGPEAPAFRLVETIEREFARGEFPSVYDGLLAIHAGQSRSLEQHAVDRLDDAQVLAISFEKGGASVLADLYLVCEAPTPAEDRFAFGYGVFLQLLDDLQDVEEDLAAGHETLFSRAARHGRLDEPTSRLARFMDAVLDGGPFAGPEFADRLDLVRRNCRALLVGTVALHPRRFSRRFRSALGGSWPVSFRAHRRLQRRVIRHWRAARGRLGAGRAGAQTPRSTSQTL